VLVRLVTFLALCLCAGCAWLRPAPPEYDAVRLPSGLVVRDLIVPDSGREVADGDEVAVHYTLRLENRTEVESSQDRGQPLRFRVGAGAVPRGLEEGVRGMRLFGRRRLSVPSELAFGSDGRPPRIPPNATVVFEVELMEHTPGGR
jgi:FKBP-type peptidyl-prolyl cis-trans isomerase